MSNALANSYEGLASILPVYLGEKGSMPDMMDVTPGPRMSCECSSAYLEIVEVDLYFVSGKVKYLFAFPLYLSKVYLKVCKRNKSFHTASVVSHCLLLWWNQACSLFRPSNRKGICILVSAICLLNWETSSLVLVRRLQSSMVAGLQEPRRYHFVNNY